MLFPPGRSGHDDATGRRIDQLVYNLYGLTEAEIRIVEDATENRR